jgi:energy-coupling factor transporter ATP-binding protein EcfA2
MQLAEVEVVKLFGRYNHHVKFAHTDRDSGGPSIVILHGPNGIGKTRLLRMIDGVLRLQFDAFRDVPFELFRIAFNDSSTISVSRGGEEPGSPLHIEYRGDASHVQSMVLHPFHSGPFKHSDAAQVDAFRSLFYRSTRTVSFQYIDALRANTKESPPTQHVPSFEEWLPVGAGSDPLAREHFVRGYAQQLAAWNRDREKLPPLADKVFRFITDAQVSHHRFFTSHEPDTFFDILRNIEDRSAAFNSAVLTGRLKALRERETTHVHYGLEKLPWDYVRLLKWLSDWESREERTPQALAAFAAYLDVLDARAKERDTLIARLRSFERLTESFFLDKKVRIKGGAKGFIIVPSECDEPEDGHDEPRLLIEHQLSSGEHQLLTLLVTALVTQRRGSVIAIDEPELSMHISWQTRLIPALIECASGAQPQFIFTTHSPDIAAKYPDALVELHK